MKTHSTKLLVAIALSIFAYHATAEERPRVEEDGTIHVDEFDLPESSFLSDESRAARRYFRDVYGPELGSFSRDCPNLMSGENDPESKQVIRQCIAEAYYKTNIYKDVTAKHDVAMAVETIGGIYTEVFTPKKGVAPKNRDRVLISIHGGGYVAGARYFSHTESIPVADMGAIKVFSPDYRMAPEFTHPAGIEDVVAVYRELLKTYRPQNIGIYGCSAGAMLTAQTISYIHANKIPMPGAIGLFCAAAPMMADGAPGSFKSNRGESAYVSAGLSGHNRAARDDQPQSPSRYFPDVAQDDPIVAPGDHDDVLSAFPPTLLISGTRDFLLSDVLATHAKLSKLGVEAELHVIEAMGHATFAFNPRDPMSDDVHNAIVRFFDKHLGK